MSLKNIVIIIGIFLISAHLIIFRTSLPVTIVAKGLGLVGLESQDVTGTLESGFQVGSLTNKEGSFRVKNVKFAFNGILDVYFKRELRISKLSFDEFYFVPSDSSVSSKEDEKTLAKSSETKTHQKKTPATDWLKLIVVDDLNFTNIHIKLAAFKTPLIVRNLRFTNYNSQTPNLLTNFIFSSNIGALSLEPYPKGEGLKISATASPIIFKSLLKDLNISGTLRIKDKLLEELNVTAFDGRLKTQLQNDDLVVKFNNLDFSQYLKQDFPISGLNGELIWGDFQHLRLDNIKTKGLTLTLRTKSFTFPDGIILVTDKKLSPSDYIFKAFNTPDLYLTFFLPTEYSYQRDSKEKEFLRMSINSNPSAEKQKLLSLVYFDKDLTELTEEERSALDKMGGYFVEQKL